MSLLPVMFQILYINPRHSPLGHPGYRKAFRPRIEITRDHKIIVPRQLLQLLQQYPRAHHPRRVADVIKVSIHIEQCVFNGLVVQSHPCCYTRQRCPPSHRAWHIRGRREPEGAAGDRTEPPEAVKDRTCSPSCMPSSRPAATEP